MKKPTWLSAVLLVAGVLGLLVPTLTAGERQDVMLTYGDSQQLPTTVILPDGYASNVKYPVVLAFPPGPGTQGMVEAFLSNYWIQEGNRRGYILVSPAVLGPRLESVGRGVVEAVFAWMDENLSYDPARVTLAGQSNGGLGAFHVARIAPEKFNSIVVMPGGYGSAGDLGQLQGKPVLLAVGELDTRWVQLSHHTRDLLVLAGAQPRVDIIPGAGHVFPYPTGQLYDWIEEQHLK